MNEQDYLEHYGVPGMRWGVRRGSSGRPTAYKKPKKNVVYSQDAAKVRRINERAKTKGIKTLSNVEIEKALKRMDLEKRYVSQVKGTSPIQRLKMINEAGVTMTTAYNSAKKAIRIGMATL